jgi:hypothetical protein
MRKICIAAAAACVLAATPALAQQRTANPYALPVGAVVGTVIGLNAYNGWWGNGSAFGASLPSTAAGAATTGFVAGIGTAALIDAATQPCAGFRALFAPFHPGPSGCVAGEYVGYNAPPPRRMR